nr:tartrate dehydrogenase [Egibacter rhizosphaerae]
MALPGDGIGREVMEPAQTLVSAAAAQEGVQLRWQQRNWSCDRYVAQGAMMPEDALEDLEAFDAIFLGAVGRPDVPDHISLWGMLIPIRRRFHQYVNLRPVRSFAGIASPLRPEVLGTFDVLVVRENVEGEYSEVGGRVYSGRPEELAIQESVFTRAGVERVVRAGFDAAAGRRGVLTSATKSNGLVHSMPFWDEIVAEVAEEHPGVEVASMHIDALAAACVSRPSTLDVIVGSNLFGDIMSDLTAAVAGSLGIAPSANLSLGGDGPSMFEPVHGSAPDIAGKGVANPIGQVWSGALMLRDLGLERAHDTLLSAIEQLLSSTDVRTADLGGSASTEEVASTLESLLAPAGTSRS